MFRTLLAAGAFVLGGLGVAQAATVYSATFSDDNGDTLEGQVTITDLGQNLDGNFGYRFDVDNQSTVDSRLTGFFFDGGGDPIVMSMDPQTVFTYKLSGNTTVPSGIGPVDFCFISGSGNNCSGGGNGGIVTGVTTSFILETNPSFDFSGLEFGLRFQSIDLVVNGETRTSIAFTGGECVEGDGSYGCPGGTDFVVPLPAGLPLILTGLGALGILARRKSA